MRTTKPLTKLPDRRPMAAGLWVCSSREFYLFEDMEGPEITIGAAQGCDIRLTSRYVSGLHAVLERRDDGIWIDDRSSHETTFIDGWRLGGRPAPLLLGLEIQLGRTVLMATDENGAFPILALTRSEMSAKGYERYGSYRLAAEYMDKSHTAVRRQARRYRARMARNERER